jgi:cadmium resistance protein CadD (predicted permease)
VNANIVAAAAGLFAVTNVDDIVILSLFFGRSAGQHGAGQHGAARRIVAGQYLGFTALLVIAVAAAYGATFLPESAIAYLGLLPLALGLRASWQAWKDHRNGDRGEQRRDERSDVTALQVASVTFANGSDNIGAYIPVFARTGIAGIAVYAAVFLILVGVWCAAGRFFATRPAVAKVIGRWGHILHPLVLITLGLFLIQGGAFGLRAGRKAAWPDRSGYVSMMAWQPRKARRCAGPVRRWRIFWPGCLMGSAARMRAGCAR